MLTPSGLHFHICKQMQTGVVEARAPHTFMQNFVSFSGVFLFLKRD